jgi:hypothetical protein
MHVAKPSGAGQKARNSRHGIASRAHRAPVESAPGARFGEHRATRRAGGF